MTSSSTSSAPLRFASATPRRKAVERCIAGSTTTMMRLNFPTPGLLRPVSADCPSTGQQVQSEIRCTPQVPARHGAVRSPVFPCLEQAVRGGAAAIAAFETAAYAEVIQRQHVGTAQREDEQHLHGPAADATHRGEPRD